MTFWQKNGWWLSLVFIVAVAFAVKLTEPSEITPVHAQISPILIIDAGHGGEDGGAVAPNGTLESEINLDIALRLETLSAFWGVETVMTRRSEQIDYPSDAISLAAKKKADQNARLELISATPGGVLLSIHQNYYPAPEPCGPQVFFGKKTGSEPFAAILQSNLTQTLSPRNRRVAAAAEEDIYLMKNASGPAVLAECGFLSNPEELAKLEREEYRLQLAAVILVSWLQHLRGSIA